MNKEEKRLKCSKAIDSLQQLIGALQEDAEGNAAEIKQLEDVITIVTAVMPVIK